MTRRPDRRWGPDFIVMGAPKAGTTALHAALTQHPDIFMSTPKEPKYWMCDDAPPPHWSGSLEPIADFEAANALEHERIAKGWAPFWRYAQLGRYGEQLAHLFSYVERERVLVLRYRDIVDDPRGAVDRTCGFLGITPGLVDSIPPDNSRGFVEPGPRTAALSRVVRARARLLPYFADDIALLAKLTGESFDDWLSTKSRGSFQERRRVS